MDTKLKTFNKGTYYTAYGFCILFAMVVAATIVMIYMGYGISSMADIYHGGHFAGENLSASTMTNINEIAIAAEKSVSRYWIMLILSGIGFLGTLAFLLVSRGRRDEEGNIKITWFDKVFGEIQLALLILAGAGVTGLGILWHEYNLSSLFILKQITGDKIYLTKGAVAAFEDIFGYGYGYGELSGFEPAWVEVLFLIAGAAICFAIGIALIVSLIKKIRAGQFWRNTICGGLILFIMKTIKENDNVFWKVMLIAVIACLLSATIIGAAFVLLGIFIFVPRFCKKYNEVKKGVEEVSSGNLNYKIPVDPNKSHGELDKLAMGINEISAASNIAVQNELKNQRLKTDLISNVSHDIKTPLTSMITYVDLMRTEGLDSEHAPEYLDIIDEKTRRLQKLTEDLFEAAKASSGDMPVRMGRIEMVSMLNQSLAEFDDKLAKRNLQVVFGNDIDRAYVNADGQLLWRVIENVLVNVSKYALSGSRVYIDIHEKANNLVVLCVKNVSKEQLNISPDELMERFKRGDSSRATEGSGLGLAIARDLTKLMGGWFDIEIDGDMFKANIALSKAHDEPDTNEEVKASGSSASSDPSEEVKASGSSASSDPGKEVEAAGSSASSDPGKEVKASGLEEA